MKKILYSVVAIAILTLASCSTALYVPGTNNYGFQTRVVLSEANYRIVKNIEVTVEVNNTNLKQEDIEKSAYAELLKEANLTGCQALANVVIEQVIQNGADAALLNPGKQYVSARGTVIEFIKK